MAHSLADVHTMSPTPSGVSTGTHSQSPTHTQPNSSPFTSQYHSSQTTPSSSPSPVNQRIQSINQCYHLLTSTCSACYVTGKPMEFSHMVNTCPHDFANDSDPLWREFHAHFRAFRNSCFTNECLTRGGGGLNKVKREKY